MTDGTDTGGKADGDSLAIPLPQLLSDDFMRDNTDYPTLAQMIAAGGVKGAADLNTPAWNSFVAAHSRHDGWPSLLNAAAEAFARRKLGL